MPLRQYGMVRVSRLFRPPESYDGWRVNRCPPRVGDVGTIVDVLQAPGLPDMFIVEACGTDGMTDWLGDFTAEELEVM